MELQKTEEGETALRSLAGLPVEAAEKMLLEEEQVECPVVHLFGPGIYIREVHLPAGIVAIGHRQKFEHMNVMLKGRVTMLKDDGTTTELVAPLVFVGKPGRKIGYISEDVVWQNIYATEETDVGKLEDTFLDKSEYWTEMESMRMEIAKLASKPDREDYEKALSEFGFTHETAKAQSENEDDMDDSHYGGRKFRLADSPIDGKGLFATFDIEEGEKIFPARIAGLRTMAGRYTNHAKTPNAEMVRRSDGDIDLVATKRIAGCRGGEIGEEITVDYRQALSLQVEKQLCQQ